LDSAEAEAVALAVAVALGLTLAAAEMVAAVVEPVVAVTLAVVDAVVELLEEAEALPLDVCARAAEAQRATTAANASIMTATDSSGVFFHLRTDSTNWTLFTDVRREGLPQIS
jgi:hypothetical protein